METPIMLSQISPIGQQGRGLAIPYKQAGSSRHWTLDGSFGLFDSYQLLASICRIRFWKIKK